MRKIKNYVNNLIYKMIQKWYVRLSNKMNGNLIRLKDDYEYMVNSKFRGCNIGVINSVECVYFALLQVYKRLSVIRLQGITVTHNNDDIQVNIYTQRPGLVIGRGGRDIDELNLILKKYFNKPVKVNLIEIKDKVFMCIL